MTSFTVGFSRSRSIWSYLIRVATHSAVSHCWIGFTLCKTPVIFHADAPGVGLVCRSRFCKSNEVMAEFSTSLNMEFVLDDLLRDLGRKYDWLGVVGHLWVLLGRVFGQRWSNPLQSPDRWFCSEVVAHLLSRAGEPIKHEPSAISPDQLLDILGKSTYATRITPKSGS